MSGSLPSRARFAWMQLQASVTAMPLPVATTPSVWRRSLIITSCLVVGAALGHTEAGIFAAFGALQTALVEAALSRKRTTLLAVLVGGATISMAFLGSLVGQTWWAVPMLVLLAFGQGVVGLAGPLQSAPFVGALAIAVIFSGTAHTPAAALQTAGYVAIGVCLQVVAWLLFWRFERAQFLRRSFANELQMLIEIARQVSPTSKEVSLASAQPDKTRAVISDAEFPLEQQQVATLLGADIAFLRRAIIAWQLLQRPGSAPRLEVAEVIAKLRLVVLHGKAQASSIEPPALQHPDWLVVMSLQQALARVADRLDEFNIVMAELLPDPQPAPLESSASGSSEQSVAPVAAKHPNFVARFRQLDAKVIRHGWRMAIGIGIAEAISLLIPYGHSFWIPLTVVFILKPDWSTTVVRSATRVMGNSAAVAVVPLLALWFGLNPYVVAAWVLCLALMMTKFFTGNYALSSFGLAGVVLLLDTILNPATDLYLERLLGTLIGAVIALAVAASLPSWRSENGWFLIAKSWVLLQHWSEAIKADLVSTSAEHRLAIVNLRDQIRLTLAEVREVSEAALLEPRPKRDPRLLVLTYGATQELQVNLLALSKADLFTNGKLGDQLREQVLKIDQGLNDLVDLAPHLPNVDELPLVTDVPNLKRVYPLPAAVTPVQPPHQEVNAMLVELDRANDSLRDMAALGRRAAATTARG